MATNKSTIDYIVEQLNNAGKIATRKMFGEYAIYCNNKVVALVCDNQLFVKPTKEGKKFIGTVLEAPPYPGAKNYYLIPGDQWEEADWLSSLIKVTALELPLPKIKKKNT